MSDGVVVLVHGRSQTPQFMAAAANRLAMPAVRFVMPAAPANTWYPESFLVPLERNEPALSSSIAALDAVIAGLLASGIEEGRIAVGGFSQGACMAAELLVRRPRAFAAAIIWTGGLIGPPSTIWPTPPALAGLPMLITNGDADPFVPEWRTHETARHFTAGGSRVVTRVLPGRGHVIADPEIAAARTLLEQALPPR